MANGEINSAIENYNSLINLNPYDAEAFGNRGDAYYQANDYVNAIKDYKQAILLEPDNDVYERQLEIALTCMHKT